ncbi:MAG: MaoC family dehydratase [Deltaproteobacteria bacterium]|nr:MaoC family dehydratase [Deltaproteobacteria bacterium]
MKVGDTEVLVKTFTPDDVGIFANLSEDRNPLHIDEAFARKTPFGRPIVHGMLVSSLFSAILGTKLPGKGTIYLRQEVNFRKPVFVGETVTATVEVAEMRSDKPICTLSTICRNSAGDIVVDGQAVVKFG